MYGTTKKLKKKFINHIAWITFKKKEKNKKIFRIELIFFKFFSLPLIFQILYKIKTAYHFMKLFLYKVKKIFSKNPIKKVNKKLGLKQSEWFE